MRATVVGAVPGEEGESRPRPLPIPHPCRRRTGTTPSTTVPVHGMRQTICASVRNPVPRGCEFEDRLDRDRDVHHHEDCVVRSLAVHIVHSKPYHHAKARPSVFEPCSAACASLSLALSHSISLSLYPEGGAPEADRRSEAGGGAGVGRTNQQRARPRTLDIGPEVL